MSVCGEKIAGVAVGVDVDVGAACWANALVRHNQDKAKIRIRVIRVIRGLLHPAFVEINQVGNGGNVVTISNSMFPLCLFQYRRGEIAPA